MKRITNMLAGATLAATVAFGMGCDAASVSDDDPSATEDVATSIAALQAEDTGGMMDEVNDVFEIAAVGSMAEANQESFAKSLDDFVSREYDASEGIWTVTKRHTFGEEGDPRYAAFTKIFQVQFLDSVEAPQKYYNTNGSIANSISFDILEAGGVVETPRLSAERAVTEGSLLAENTHTDTITVSGTYRREGAHEIETDNAVRTMNFELDLEIVELVGPRGSGHDLSEKVSGTIIGEYDAARKVVRGDSEREDQVHREFKITIEDGESVITIDGNDFSNDLESGDVG